MAKKRTKDQKKKIETKRKMQFVFSDQGVVVSDFLEKDSVEKKATTPFSKKRVESSFGAETVKLLYQDLRKTGIVTVVVFCILIGIYLYIR